MRCIYFFIISILSLMQCSATENHMQSDKYFEAIKHIDKACELAQKIENEDVKVAVISELVSCKECFEKDYLTKNYADMSDRAIGLNENIGEVLADCNQDNLRMGIASCIGEMAEQFQE